MADKFDLKAIISMVDRMSPSLKAIQKNVNAMRRTFLAAGKDGQIMAAGLAASLAVPAKLFADAESAGINLKNSLLDKNGVAGGYEKLMEIATQLGNVLPGNTSDFAKMATVMRSNSVVTQDMIDGGLKAAAYLGVLVDDTEGAARGLAKLSNVFGIAGSDLTSFADTAQRVTSLGVPLEDFVQAMSKAGGPLKAVGAQGLKVANEVAPLVALLTQAGIQADEAGTGVKTMINEFAKAGKFTTIPNMVRDLEKMHRLNPKKLMEIMEELFGKEHASKALIVAAGGYGELAKKMENMADINQKIGNQLSGLTAIIDSMTGTIQNAGAAFGSVYAPQIKAAAQWTNVSADSMRNWIGANGPMIMAAIELAAGIVGMKLAMLGAAGAMAVLNTVLKANPWMALVQGLLIAAPLIYSNFDKIVEYVSYRIEDMANILKSVKDFFSFDLFSGNGSTMRAPGFVKPIVKPNRVSGSVDVNFNNAPSGMRVSPAKSQGPLSVNPNVGYRAFSLGMP